MSINYAKDKWLRKTQAGYANGKWQKNFSSPEASNNYNTGMAAFLGVSPAQISSSSAGKNFQAAQANAGQMASKAQAKINQTTADKWQANLQRAFTS